MFRLHPILRLIYFLLRIFAWLSGHLFYRRYRVLGRENLPHFQGPAIVISNHPSTLMDVLNVGLLVPKVMFFLANYGLFKNPISNWILTRLYCIPVKRKEDVAEGDARNNDSAFEKSFQHLEKQGVLFIAPEGYSYMNRWVREFKTGSARIAFGTESRNDWQLGLKIYPVGLSYSAANLFRSEVVINFGEPVAVQDWAGAFTEHRDRAVDALTAELQQRVTDLTVQTRDETGEEFITQLETILANARPLPQEAAFRRSQALAAQYLDDAALRSEVTSYFTDLQAANLEDAGIEETLATSSATQSFRAVFLLVLGAPFFVLGYSFWALPFFLPWLLAKRLHLYVGYDSTLKVLAGAIVVPLWLWGAFRLIRHFSGDTGLALLALLGFLALAWLVEGYRDVFQRFLQKQRVVFFAKKQPGRWTAVLEKRRTILQAIPEKIESLPGKVPV
ncbi:MAG: 1-acyl-sn-glycerol-3-phosphate acyltransferase [Saprospiraceae bacterium]